MPWSTYSISCKAKADAAAQIRAPARGVGMTDFARCSECERKMMAPRPRHAQSLKKANSKIRKLESRVEDLSKPAARDAESEAALFRAGKVRATRALFDLVATAINESVVLEPAFVEEDPEGWRQARQRFAEEMADALEPTNGNFDRERFLEEATK